jgi:hypothetical protein
VRDLAKFPTAQIDTEIILKAIETMRRYSLSFWHASSFRLHCMEVPRFSARRISSTVKSSKPSRYRIHFERGS